MTLLAFILDVSTDNYVPMASSETGIKSRWSGRNVASPIAVEKLDS